MGKEPGARAYGHRGGTADAVKAGDQFRHLGHGRAFGQPDTDPAAEQHTRDDGGVADDVFVQQGCNDSDQHTDGGDLITELANDGYDIVQSKVTHMLGNNLELSTI